jgi:hypothetical protein
VPFLKLTRDRRGFEHTFLLHADVPGEAPRVLYWFRTAPGVLIGRPALDEEAIRTIEDQHPHIEFDWPAILALREAMPPEDEAEPVRQPRGRRNNRRGEPPPRSGRRPQPAPDAPPMADLEEDAPPQDVPAAIDEGVAPTAEEPSPATTTHGLLEELVGRDIATRLRARHAEIMARIHQQDFDEPTLAAWVARAEALDPDTWLTPEAILDGVRDADARYEQVRAALGHR